MSVCCVYDKDRNMLMSRCEGGLGFAGIHTLYNLIDIYKNGRALAPVHIDWDLKWWNKPDQCKRNMFELYFKQAKEKTLPSFSNDMFISEGRYVMQKVDFSLLIPIRDLHFKLSDEVADRERFFIDKYSINPDKVIVVYYRGTDKGTEIPSIDPSVYLMCIEGLLKHSPDCRVLIQTDQLQVLDYFRHNLPGKVFNIGEMPLSKANVAIHKDGEKLVSNYELGVNYLAVLSLISKCKNIILSESGGSWWIQIFRGNSENIWEFYKDEHGRLEIFKKP